MELDFALLATLSLVVGFCATLQVSYYLTLVARRYFVAQVALASALSFAYAFVPSVPGRVCYAIGAVVLCCALCAVSYREKPYHKLYSTLIQAVVTTGILYASTHIAIAFSPSPESIPSITVISAIALNAVWCTLMFVALKRIFTVLPEPESNYRKTFIASCIVYAALLACINGGEVWLLTNFPSSAVFAGLVSVIVVLSVVGILWQCRQSNDQMIEEDRLERIAAQNEIMERYVNEHVDFNNSIRVIEHDQRHLINTLSALLEMGDLTEAKSILGELSRRTAALKRRGFCSDNTVNAMLVDTAHRCDELSVAFEADVRLPEPIAIENIDLISLLTNVLNNAVECCERLKDPASARIATSVMTISGLLAITCTNTVDEAPRISGGRIASTKHGDGRAHGIGIESIHLAAKEHNGTVSMDTDGTTFTIEIVMDNRPRSTRPQAQTSA